MRWAGALLRGFLAARGTIETPLLTPEGRSGLAAIRETRRRTALLMNDAAALHLQTCVQAARRLPGAMAEAGVYRGGSARLICEAKGDTQLHLFDVFETLRDTTVVGGDDVRAHFGAVHGRRAEVEALVAGYPAVTVQPGLFPQSARGLEALRFSFVHLDLDLPRGTRDGLAFFAPRMVPGGVLIGDDYQDVGVRGVFSDYFADRSDTLIALPWGQVMVVKQGGR